MTTAQESRSRAKGAVTVALLGDLMLAGEWDELARQNKAAGALTELARTCAGNDLVFANLEVALHGRDGVITKEPRVIGRPETVGDCLEMLGVGVVCLANNHVFDGLLSGFQRLRHLLEQRRILHFGASDQPYREPVPLMIDRLGIRFGWLGYVALTTRPSHVARPGHFGVRAFDKDVAREEIRQLRREVDHVIVSLHWGIEYCHLPSPEQIAAARQLVEAGASLVVGHHAHVIQGVETHHGGVIAYNLGNAVTTDLTIGGRLAIRQNRRTKSSFLLRAHFSKDRLQRIETIPFRLRNGLIRLHDPYARHLLEKANHRLAHGISTRRWRIVRIYEDVLVRTLTKLHPRVIRSLRPSHVLTLFRNLYNSLSGKV